MIYYYGGNNDSFIHDAAWIVLIFTFGMCK